MAARTRNRRECSVDFNIPKDIADYLVELDRFIEREIKPLENKDDNIRFFDHRREAARTDWDRGGLPNQKWEALLAAPRSAQGRPLSLSAAGAIRRQERQQSWHGDQPGASGGQGAWLTQRSSDRAFDRRQQRGRAADARLWYRSPETAVGRGAFARHHGFRLRHHRARA